MKKITGIVIVLIALFFAGYYGMGVITERTVKNNLAVVNQSNGLYANVANYKRGWFESHALLDWSIHVPARVVKSANGQMENIPAQDYQVQMPLTIYHGPVIFSDRGVKFGLGYAHTDLMLPPNLLKQFNDYFTKESTQPKMDISLLVDYKNNTQIEIAIPQFNLIAQQGKMTFDWLGMTSDVDTTGSLSDINGRFSVDGVRFVQDKMVLTLGKVSGKYNLHKTDSGLFYGDANTVVPSVLIQSDDEKMFELDEFCIDSNTEIQKDLFSAYLKSSMDKLFINGRTFGPGHLDVAVKNLDAGVLANINAQINKAQQGTDLEKQQAMLAVLPELPKLLAQGPTLEISSMQLVVSEGTVDGSFMITLPAGSLANPFELIQKVQGDGKLKLPIKLVKELVTQSVKIKLMSNALASNEPVVAQSTNAITKTDAASEVNKANTVGAVESATKPASDVDISQQVVTQTDEQINAMLQSGLIVKQNDDYLTTFKLNQGQLVINGKPFNPAMLKF